jgi:fatty acid desaturase
VNHHLEHHLLVFVPCWRLPEVRALLLAKQLGDRIEIASSYAEVVRRVVIRRSATATAGT